MTDWAASRARLQAPAKINLSLSVVGSRSDGYHELDSVVVPVDLYDAVVVDAGPSDTASVTLTCAPRGAAPESAENLAVRAAEHFLLRSRRCARVAITLTKNIPAGAGLGGGSSDAAAVLRCLNALSAQPIDDERLAAWAAELGADVPLFLFGRPARMRGIGEWLEAIAADADPAVVIAFSGTGVETRAVYAAYDDLLTTGGTLHSIRSLTSVREALRHMHNDLEAAAVHLRPELRRLKERLRALGAAGVSMTGSGSAMFGWWQSRDEADEATHHLRASGVWAHTVRILERIPAVEVMTR